MGLKSVCLDTNILAYFFEESPRFGSLVKKIVRNLQKDKTELKITFLTLAEILVHPVKLNDEGLIELYSNIQNHLNIQIIYPNEKTALIAAQLRAEYNIKTPDALNIAIAISNNCSAFLTNDETLKKIKPLKILLLKEGF